MTNEAKNTEPSNVLYRIQRGLCGYVSYLAACEMNQAFSEYVLYEPILRVLMARGFKVACEYECPGIAQPARGDKKRLDFYATKDDLEFAIEVKWAKSKRINVEKDIEKLTAFAQEKPNALALLCVFGRKSHIENIELGSHQQLKQKGTFVYADLRRTKYGCRMYQIKTVED